MKRFPFLTVVAGAVLLLSSCKSANKSGLAIPKDAAVVFHINAASLSSKLPWEEVKKTEWFKDAYNDSKDSLAKKIMDDPKASGVDPAADFAFFLKKRGRGGFSLFEGSVKDAAAFEALAKKISHQDKVDKDGDWNVLTAENNTVVTWNNSKFAVVNDVPLGGFNPVMANTGETTRFTADSLKIFARNAMANKDGSLFDDDRFASVMKEAGDVHFWLNSGLLYTDMMGMMSMMKFGSLLEGNVMAGTVNFEDGKIAGRLKQFYGEEMRKAMDKWKFKNVDASVLNRIPSNNVIGVMAMNMDPAALRDFLKTIGVDGLANMTLSKANTSLDEVLSATKGQFVMAVSDLQMKDTIVRFQTANGEQAYPTSKPDMSFLFATDVNQKAALQKLLDMVKPQMPEGSFAYQLNNDWFVAGNKADAVNGFASGNKTSHAFADKISGHPFGFYLDVQRLLKTNFSKDAHSQSLLAQSAAVWQDVVMVANEYKNGVATADLTINMVDGKTNSLKQLNQYIEKMHATNKAHKVAMGNDGQTIQMDTATTIAPGPMPPQAEEEPKH